MKKMLYVAATLFAAGFVSCSENSNDNLQGNNFNSEERVPILFTVGNGRVDITTRGTGAVGTGETSFWRGENLNVYMFNKGTLDIAKDQDQLDIFNNEVVLAPEVASATNSGSVKYVGDKYYPTSGDYDFFAYHADDAIVEGNTPELNDDETMYVVPVTIDGTQDLMIAKAIPTAEDTVKLQQNVDESEYELSYARAYSAYSARKDVQPNFIFQHLLSRLVFKIKPNSKKDLAVSIEEVRIKNVNTTADFVVAWKGKTPDSLLLKARNVNDVVLMEKNPDIDEAHPLLPFTPQSPRWNEEDDEAYIDQLGESMLLMPQDEYQLYILMEENGIRNHYEATIRPPKGGKFEAGYEYNVTFVVYGLEKIELNVALEPWKLGDDIIADSDELKGDDENVTEDEEEEEEEDNEILQ
ncbi:MAG: fimbrillin family protein [Bacteroidaceae bacterium]|nr:fimbrillin family protein [Bacteroidaceae bacterium]